MADTPSGSAPPPAVEPGQQRDSPRAEPAAADVNFSSIVGLDAVGGWHIIQISSEGTLSADAAAMRVLHFFFPDAAAWSSGLPAPLSDAFFEARDWGMKRVLGRAAKSLVFYRHKSRLSVHYVPRGDHGHVVLRTGPAVAGPSALQLTEREQEIAALVVAGKTNAEIGLVLDISARTVQKHLENIFRKLGVETRMALAMRVNAAHTTAMG